MDHRDLNKDGDVDHEEHIVEANKLMDKAEATAVQAKALMEDAEATVNQAQTEVEEAAKKLAQEDKPALAAAVDSLSEKIGDVKEDIQESIQDMKKLISDFVPDEIEDNVIYVAKSVNYLFSDFIAFINRGNVLDLAVGVIIGAGFTGIVNATVDDFLSPVLANLTKDGPALTNQMYLLRPGISGNMTYDTYDIAKKDGAIAIFYGHWLQAVLNFLFVTPVLYLIVRLFAVTQDQKKRKEDEEKALAEKELTTCPYCFEKVHKKAVKCKSCISELVPPIPYGEAANGAKMVAESLQSKAAQVKATLSRGTTLSN